jgi:hypothetical protein
MGRDRVALSAAAPDFWVTPEGPQVRPVQGLSSTGDVVCARLGPERVHRPVGGSATACVPHNGRPTTIMSHDAWLSDRPTDDALATARRKERP